MNVSHRPLVAPPAMRGAPVLAAPRVTMLPAPIIELTPEVREEIAHLKRTRHFVDESMERREQYLASIEEIFRAEGVPAELLNVAMIESGFSLTARSRSGAVGMWQFMKGTAQVYGLKVSRHEDQRKDLVLSTTAAARHLRDLYLAYRDWYLALAAYNAGSAAIDRAINHARTDDFWALSRGEKSKLHLQTRRYVPRFIAATYLMRAHLGEQRPMVAENLSDSIVPLS